MEAALAEFAALNSELELELEDDVDFVGPAGKCAKSCSDIPLINAIVRRGRSLRLRFPKYR